MRLVGERKALAAAVLALYTLLYLVNSLLGPEPLKPLFAALSGLYGLSFLSLVAGYFWARWFGIGLGLYGVIGAIMVVVQAPDMVDYDIMFYGGTHGLLSLVLWGASMSGDFDGRSEWRARFHLDEFGARRLGKSVIRIGITLPILIIYGLAPKSGAPETVLTLAVLAAALLGFRGLVKMRTWGVLLIGMSALAVAATALVSSGTASVGHGIGVELPAAGMVASMLLMACALPFAAPMARYLLRSR